MILSSSSSSVTRSRVVQQVLPLRLDRCSNAERWRTLSSDFGLFAQWALAYTGEDSVARHSLCRPTAASYILKQCCRCSSLRHRCRKWRWLFVGCNTNEIVFYSSSRCCYIPVRLFYFQIIAETSRFFDFQDGGRPQSWIFQRSNFQRPTGPEGKDASPCQIS